MERKPLYRDQAVGSDYTLPVRRFNSCGARNSAIKSANPKPVEQYGIMSLGIQAVLVMTSCPGALTLHLEPMRDALSHGTDGGY